MPRTSATKIKEQAAVQDSAAVEEQTTVAAAETAQAEEPEQELTATAAGKDTPQEEGQVRVAALEEQVRQLTAQLQQPAQPQIIQLTGDVERVHFLWQAEVSDDNVVTFGEGGMFGRVVGKSGSFYVPKQDLSRMMDERTRYFLDQRWLLVISGLNQEEREAWGVNYTDGEVLDKKYFAKLVELGDEVLDLYPALCASHREMVVKRYCEAYQNGNPAVTRDLVSRLNELSRRLGEGKGKFTAILEDMNAKEIAGN